MNEYAEKIREILADIHPGEDLSECDDLIDGGRIDSLSVISLVAELEDAFDITVPAAEIVPENFNSVGAIAAMTEKLAEEDY